MSTQPRIEDQGTSVNAPKAGSLDALAYAELMKPELTGLSVLTAVFAYLASAGSLATVWGVAALAGGTLLVGGACGSLNQLIEREHDGLMRRTERRPLPSGRLTPQKAMLFGVAQGSFGVGILFAVSGLLPALLALATMALYLGAYTPMKRKTPWNTFVGAIPGALPTLIGWTAGSHTVNLAGWVFFGLLFFWQFPHFLSLSWLYRKDYARAGFRMVAIDDSENGRTTNAINLVACSILVGLTSLMTYVFDLRPVAVGASVGLSLAFLWLSWRVWKSGTAIPGSGSEVNVRARQLFFGSLAYLPILMMIGLLDKV